MLWLKKLGNLPPKSCMIIKLQQNKIFREKSSQCPNLSTLHSWKKLVDLKHLLDFYLKYFSLSIFFVCFWQQLIVNWYIFKSWNIFSICKNIFPNLFIYFFPIYKRNKFHCYQSSFAYMKTCNGKATKVTKLSFLWVMNFCPKLVAKDESGYPLLTPDYRPTI